MMMIFGARAVFLLPAISSEHLCRLEGSSRARDGGTARGVARAAAAQNVAAGAEGIACDTGATCRHVHNTRNHAAGQPPANPE